MANRANALRKRYGLGSAKAARRTIDWVTRLADLGCHPTLPAPGRVVERHPRFFQHLHTLGVEVAMHGYDHVDFRTLSLDDTMIQFDRATTAFRDASLRFDGFRCPYLSCTDNAREIARKSGCAYSSNSAVMWNVVDEDRQRTVVFDQLCSFYRASSSSAAVSVPRMVGGLLEIPASSPDDLQLCDGLGYASHQVGRTWIRILRETHRRGELFVLVFHPEALGYCGEAIESVLVEASHLASPVWMATLRDISKWWMAKSGFNVQTTARSTTLEIAFRCDADATVLARGIDAAASGRPFMDGYHVVDNRTLRVSSHVRPFVGIAPDIPSETANFLTQQGYILETGNEASRCGVYLDAARLGGLSSEVQLIQHIESSHAPLVRFWRWPRNARSALAVTGDLDALSLMDYVARIVTL